MTEMDTDEIEIAAEAGHSIYATVWSPQGKPSRVIQIFHGLGEHRARYARFAACAVARGIAVIAHDHRGHGLEADEPGFFADHNGWQKLSDDGLRAHEHIGERFPETPIALLGHSMGSYVAQYFAMQYSERIQALILSASTWPDKAKIFPGRLIAKVESWRLSRHGKSTLLDKLGFGDFNRRFEPARTELDWLSRDTAEVDAYIKDPLCGGPYSCGLWLDILGGLLSISSDKSLADISADLPILLTGGANDPVGGEVGIAKLAAHYRGAGHDNLNVKIYPEGRHEMFNETNRDEFTSDLLDWIAQQLADVTER
jgi:alpha-beta hydrolase superfamily lysophospholipase